MKVHARVLEHEGNLGGEKIGMTIDDAAMQHIMSVLTDLYSDPELAVVREYSTNALDSHVEAGVKRPIEVTLPSALSPFFKVRDYGIGLDADGIREIYSRYGTSTKRQSDDVVGMLGLGCKSALTYTDQFTLTGIKDGRMVQVSIGRDEDGSGSMTIVADQATTLDNGVEVIVPAKRHNQFEGKAHDFFKFWQEGTVLVNGEQPKRIDGRWITDRLLLATDAEPCVVMGNVAYPIPDEDERDQYGRARRHTSGWTFGRASGYGQPTYSAVCFVDIGDVQFTPSREALQMTKYTRATLDRLKQELQSKLDDSLAKQIEDAPTANDALRLHIEAKAIGLSRTVKYKGHDVPDRFNRWPSANAAGVRPDETPANSYLLSGHSSYARKTGERSFTVDIEKGQRSAWFVNFDQKELTSYKREKLDVFWGQTLKPDEFRPSQLIFVKEMTADEKFWTAGAKVYDWADVDAIKLTKDTKAVNSSGKPRGSYTARVGGRWTEALAETFDPKKLLWTHGNRYMVESLRELRAGLIPDTFTIVGLPANRVDKFKRDFPEAKRVEDYVKELVAAYVKGISADDLAAVKFQRTYGSYLVGLDETKVDDPALKRHIIMAKRPVTPILNKLNSLSHWLYASNAMKETTEPHPLKKYPLLLADRRYGSKQIGKAELDHAYLYINAAYAAEGSV